MAAGDCTKQWGMVWVIVVLSIAVHVIDGASIYLGKPAPGVYSSPILLVVALALLITTQRDRRNAKDAPASATGRRHSSETLTIEN